MRVQPTASNQIPSIPPILSAVATPTEKDKKTGGRPKRETPALPQNCLSIGGTVITRFVKSTVERYDFLSKTNEALELAAQYDKRDFNLEPMTEPEYQLFDGLLKATKDNYFSEKASMNWTCKKHVDEVIETLDNILEKLNEVYS